MKPNLHTRFIVWCYNFPAWPILMITVGLVGIATPEHQGVGIAALTIGAIAWWMR